MHKIFVFALALFLFCPFTGLAQDSPVERIVNHDILGIKLGMTYDEAKAIVEKRDPNYEVSTYLFDDGSFAGADFTYAPNQRYQPVEVIALRATSAGKLYYIGREQNFDSNQDRPTQESTKKALELKYGDDGVLEDTWNGGKTITWSLDRKDVLFKGKSNSRHDPCQVSGNNISYTNLLVPSRFGQHCSRKTKISFQSDKDTFVTTLSVELADVAMMYDEAKRKQQEKEKTIEEEKNKMVMPEL